MSTPLQHKICQFIEQYSTQHGFSPSLAEIASGIGISANSLSLVSRNIHALVDAGKLKFHKKGYRNIQIVGQGVITVPVVGRIAAGEPIEAIEDPQSLDLASLFTGRGQFVLEVKGDSMMDEGILEGDFVICRPVREAREGEIVVALIDSQEVTLKRLSYKIKERITLVPANPQLKPKAYLPHRVQVQGVFIGLLRLSR
ncbi:MAG: repressor LexA [Gammaproteobacteria bacterium RIFCSPHIGHO2_12_FULL_43_28]|nr:MAG: repressor LexA [Gammaproteobacteria bacterium RIFCSPHIGHO2_12_FULL_43_28]